MKILNKNLTSFQDTFDDIIPINLKNCEIQFDLSNNQSTVLSFRGLNFKQLISLSSKNSDYDFYSILSERKKYHDLNHNIHMHFCSNKKALSDLLDNFDLHLKHLIHKIVFSDNDYFDIDILNLIKEDIKYGKNDSILFLMLIVDSINQHIENFESKHKDTLNSNADFNFQETPAGFHIDVGGLIHINETTTQSVSRAVNMYLIDHVDNLTESRLNHKSKHQQYLDLKEKVISLDRKEDADYLFSLIKEVKTLFRFSTPEWL